LVDSAEDWAGEAVNRQWPGVMQSFNPLLPRDIDEADLSAIPTLVEIGQKMAADMDWKKILTFMKTCDKLNPVDAQIPSVV
jgi:hypothetical protein